MTRKLKQVTLFGFTGTGDTKAAAVAEATKQLETLSVGPWNPVILEWRGNVAIVYRTPADGWSHTLINEAGAVPVSQIIHVVGGGDDTFQKAEARARMHLAHLGWKRGDVLEGSGVLNFLYTHQISDFKSWAEFQERYADVADLGLSPHLCHAYACHGPGMDRDLYFAIERAVASRVLLSTRDAIVEALRAAMKSCVGLARHASMNEEYGIALNKRDMADAAFHKHMEELSELLASAKAA